MSDLSMINAPLENAPVTSIAMALLFSTIIFTTVSLSARSWLAGDNRAIIAAMNPKASPLDLKSFTSIFSLLYHWSVFGLILFVTYICEYHPLNPHGEKSYDRDEFFLMTAILFVASSYTVSKNDKTGTNKKTDESKKHHLEVVDKNPSKGTQNGSNTHLGDNKKSAIVSAKSSNDILNRDQTEEWKGWMQFIFLFYHYYHAEEIYNSIRIMITCYIWMTGFGNFSYFYMKGDYSLVRVIQMLWRLNFLVIFLCLTQGTTYILYYICPLHTYFFLMVYVTMRIGKHMNYTKYGLRMKLSILAIIIYLLWDVDSGLFHLFHFPFLSDTPKTGAKVGSMWEWYFRTSLDHWSAFLGMLFAVNYPITSLFFRKLESQPFVLHALAKIAVGLGLLGAFYIWTIGPFMLDKTDYNNTNSYFGFIPLITFIFFRNLTPTLRSYSLGLLHQIGKSTLETYLMQHHIWLTSNAKSLLIIIPGWHKCNMLVVTFAYFYISRRLYKLTLYLREMHLPNDQTKCFHSIAAILLIITICYGIALSLTSMGLNSLTPIAIVSVPCGYLLYQTILDTSWSSFRESFNPLDISAESFFESIISPQKNSNPPKSHATNTMSPHKNILIESDTQVARLTPPVIGAMAIFILGITWNGLATNGGGKISTLPPTCAAYANMGNWVPVNPCNEGQKGEAFRSYDVSGLVCTNPETDVKSISGTYVWGWQTSSPNTLCRFSYRDSKQMMKQVDSRVITFVGDSMTRNLFFATLRSMGVPNSGGYDATIPKHSDIKQALGKTTTIEFRWAPLAQDQLDVIKENNSMQRADIIITGGGAWDRLHVWATDEDQASHKSTVKDLAQEISNSVQKGIPVVWVTPTTINTPALNHEDKRDHMKESDMEEMRQLYADLGILSKSSFVLDGPSFTHERVLESYDGVHYPPQIYSAGAQILFNAFDWLLDPNDVTPKQLAVKKTGSMANPFLGLMMLCFVFIGLFFFDGFMGFSFLASFFVGGALPNELYESAFAELHEKNNLPLILKNNNYTSTRTENDVDDGFENLLTNPESST